MRRDLDGVRPRVGAPVGAGPQVADPDRAAEPGVRELHGAQGGLVGPVEQHDRALPVPLQHLAVDVADGVTGHAYALDGEGVLVDGDDLRVAQGGEHRVGQGARVGAQDERRAHLGPHHVLRGGLLLGQLQSAVGHLAHGDEVVRVVVVPGSLRLGVPGVGVHVAQDVGPLAGARGAPGDVRAGAPGVGDRRGVDVRVVRVLLGCVRQAPVVGERVAEVEQHLAAGLGDRVAELLVRRARIELGPDAAQEVDLDRVDLPAGELPCVGVVVTPAAQAAALAAVVGAGVGVDACLEAAFVQVGHQRGDAGGEAVRVGDQPPLCVAGVVGLPAAVEPHDVVTGFPQTAVDQLVRDGAHLLFGGGAEAVVGVPAHVGRRREAAVVVGGGSLVGAGAGHGRGGRGGGQHGHDGDRGGSAGQSRCRGCADLRM